MLDTFFVLCYYTQGAASGVYFMEQKLEQAYLYDFYGELLKDRQRKIYEDFIFNDLSLGEIAEEEGISRQGVHDLIRRCDRILQEYENKLHLVERFDRAKRTVAEIERLTAETENQGIDGCGSMKKRLQTVRKLSLELLKEF